MFGDKALHEVEHADLVAFLAESRDEGVRLDYKEEWTPKIVVNACAFANTYGGYILYGVKEVAQKNRPNQPDPLNVPGVSFSKGDPAASLRSRILDNTRPPVPLEIRAATVGLEQMAVEPFVMSKGGCEPLITAAFRSAGLRPDTRYEAREVGTVLAMVEEGLGVTLVPELALPAGGARRVRTVPLEPPIERRLALGIRSLRTASPATKAFLDLAVAHQAASAAV